LALATVVEASGTANSNEADVRINANSFFMVFLLFDNHWIYLQSGFHKARKEGVLKGSVRIGLEM